jgi:hypothetical protein
MHLVGQKSDTSKRKMLYDIQSNTNQNLAIENFAKKKKLDFHKAKWPRKFARIWFFLQKFDFSQRKMSSFKEIC